MKREGTMSKAIRHIFEYKGVDPYEVLEPGSQVLFLVGSERDADPVC